MLLGLLAVIPFSYLFWDLKGLASVFFPYGSQSADFACQSGLVANYPCYATCRPLVRSLARAVHKCHDMAVCFTSLAVMAVP